MYSQGSQENGFHRFTGNSMKSLRTGLERCARKISQVSDFPFGFTNNYPCLICREGRALIHDDASSDDVLKLASRWILNCIVSHPECANSNTPQLPTRVLDVGIDGSDCLALRVTNGFRASYLALSYCWGSGNHDFETTKGTLKSKMRSISMSILPSTIVDAIIITRRLKVQYLWVDALCIVQDDLSDWRREAAQMADIYQNSLCTIAATGASSSSEGCFLPRPASQVPVRPCHLYWDDSTDIDEQKREHGPVLIPSTPQWEISVTQAPLHQRAWVLQERSLSSRILHWSKDSIFWECSKLKASEAWPAGLPCEYSQPGPIKYHSAVKEMSTKEALTSEWFQTVMDYSKRGLTQEKDKLAALSGLAKRVHDATGDEYLAGVWRRGLTEGLMWSGSPATDEAPRKRPETYIAPTWSWASIVGPVVFDAPENGYRSSVEVLSASTTLSGIDRTGQVSSGRIRVSGFLSRRLVAIRSEDEDDRHIACILDPAEDPALSILSRPELSEFHIIYDAVPSLPLQPFYSLEMYEPGKTPDGDDIPKSAMAIVPVVCSVSECLRIGWINTFHDGWFERRERSVLDIF